MTTGLQLSLHPPPQHVLYEIRFLYCCCRSNVYVCVCLDGNTYSCRWKLLWIDVGTKDMPTKWKWKGFEKIKGDYVWVLRHLRHSGCKTIRRGSIITQERYLVEHVESDCCYRPYYVPRLTARSSGSPLSPIIKLLKEAQCHKHKSQCILICWRGGAGKLLKNHFTVINYLQNLDNE